MNKSKEPSSLEHIAIIMDGNGRWAKARSHTRAWGHIRGSKIVSKIVEEADNLGVKALTLYAFSTENWSRPVPEVQILFLLLKKFLLREEERIIKNNIRFKVMGDISELPQETQKIILSLEDRTKSFGGLKLTFAFGYGGRNEILSAVNKFMAKNPGVEIREEDLAENLFIPDIGDVDLLIRTSGDQRISNFLLWQVAYSELFFTPTPWPNFSAKEFREIIYQVSSRERRFGMVHAVESLDHSRELGRKNKDFYQAIRRN